MCLFCISLLQPEKYRRGAYRNKFQSITVEKHEAPEGNEHHSVLRGGWRALLDMPALTLPHSGTVQ